jgi:hypothetical protein
MEAGNGRDKTIQSMHSDKQGIRFQEDNNIHKDKGTVSGPFQPRYGSSAPAHQSASWRYLGIFLPDVSPKSQSNLLTGFLSQVLESDVFPTWVDLFLQRKDFVGQPMGGKTDSCQALLFQVVDFVGQSCYLREF